MYFTDISDTELRYYHHTVKNNFSLPLTDILTSDMFKIEEIITDSIYKVYPLFYCDSIESTNSNDKILENKCIICQKDSNTRIYFNDTAPLIQPNIICKSLIRVTSQNVFYRFNPIFLCFDSNSNTPLSNAKLTCDLHFLAYSPSDNVDYYETGVSSNDGLVYLRQITIPYIESMTVTGSITVEHDGEIVTIWEAE